MPLASSLLTAPSDFFTGDSKREEGYRKNVRYPSETLYNITITRFLY